MKNIKNTLDSIPDNNSNAKEITRIVKKNNKTVGYEIANEFVDKDVAIKMAKNGEIKNVGIAHRKDTEYLKTIPDNTSRNNLS
jgi:hypothetical protein